VTNWNVHVLPYIHTIYYKPSCSNKVHYKFWANTWRHKSLCIKYDHISWRCQRFILNGLLNTPLNLHHNTALYCWIGCLAAIAPLDTRNTNVESNAGFKGIGSPRGDNQQASHGLWGRLSWLENAYSRLIFFSRWFWPAK